MRIPSLFLISTKKTWIPRSFPIKKFFLIALISFSTPNQPELPYHCRQDVYKTRPTTNFSRGRSLRYRSYRKDNPFFEVSNDVTRLHNKTSRFSFVRFSQNPPFKDTIFSASNAYVSVAFILRLWHETIINGSIQEH